MFELNDSDKEFGNVKVVGVGTGGSHIINTLTNFGLKSVDFITVDTDAQALSNSKAQLNIQIGEKLTRGLGTEGSIEIGEQAATDSRTEIISALKGADMVFILTGLGGGTGTGAAPIIASCAKELGALTISIAGTPFSSEGSHRSHKAEQGAYLLKQNSDSFISLDNDRLRSFAASEENPADPDFKLMAEFIYEVINCILTLTIEPGLINLDFDDVKSIMANKGTCVVGIGIGQGENGTTEAARKAVELCLFDENIQEATGVLLNVIGSEDNLSMYEVTEAANIIHESVNASANIIWGASADNTMGDSVQVVIIVTGFDSSENTALEPCSRNDNYKEEIYQQIVSACLKRINSPSTSVSESIELIRELRATLKEMK